MRADKSNKKSRKSLILVLVFCLGVGFAVLSSQLSIIGNMNVKGQIWSVHLENIQVKPGSIDAELPTINQSGDSIEYSVDLELPGDYYEFSVDAVNAGTIDAIASDVSLTGISSEISSYFTYELTYADGSSIGENDIIRANTTTTYRILVKYRDDIPGSALSAMDTSLSLSFSVLFNQYDNRLNVSEFAELVKSSALPDQNIDFTSISSASNGRGLYIRKGTANKLYPIYYYRGNVSNNNALFAGFCWKIVRTTESGGTKLIYNGLPGNVYSSVERLNNSSYTNITNTGMYPFEFNSENKTWISTATQDVGGMEMTFSVETDGDYYLNYRMAVGEEGYSNIDASIYKDGNFVKGIYDESGIVKLFGLTPSNVIKISYSRYAPYEEDIEEVDDFLEFSLDKGTDTVIGCENEGTATQLASTSAFNTNYTSPAYNGYMYGTPYSYRNDKTTSSTYFYGSDFEFVDVDSSISGDGTYTLTSTSNTADSTHHYTCFNTTGECSELYYIFSINATTAYYISLKDGKSVEDALNDMKINTTNSTIKTAIDTWFNDTFKTYFTNRSKDYNNYLEDTIWCNDRSMNTLEVAASFGNSSVNNGWKPNGGDLSNSLFYSGYARGKLGEPSLKCSNKNDSFTVTESEIGNGSLTYPVGLLTSDEVVLAGGGVSGYSNNDYYLYTNKDWWTMSPYMFFASDRSYQSSIAQSGRNDFGRVEYSSMGVRPAISVRSNVKIAPGGDGSIAHPYQFVVE